VVEALELTPFVDLIIAKPAKIVDDLPVNEIFTNRLYLEDK